VLDLSETALESARARLGERASAAKTCERTTLDKWLNREKKLSQDNGAMDKTRAVFGSLAGCLLAEAFAVFAIAALALTPALVAQQLTGNIFGNVQDEQAARLVGATVTLSGIGAPQTVTTDQRGEFRFLNLSPGSYTIAFEQSGFSKVTKTDVQVAVGKNTEVSATLRLSTVETGVTVRGEAAILDPRRVSTGATITQVELNEIPTARDPWVILQTVPGVLTDTINVGGNQSGQQAAYYGKGAMGFNNVWNLDGIGVTDLASTGAATTYYDFDSFEEMSVTTGGADITQMTPGVQLNLVTKRGTNDVHGSARVYLTREQWQSQNLSAEAAAQGFTGGSRIDNIQDYGIEVGGPLWKDRAWLWGAYSRNQIDLFTITNASDRTTLEDANLKLNLQLTESTSATGSYTQGDKIKFGRNGGVTNPPETAWNQSGVNGQPVALDRVEVSQVVSSRLFLTASYAYVRSGFQLVPVGGVNVNDVYQDSGGVWHNSYFQYRTQRPQNVVAATGSYLFNTGSTGHELKFGFSYRKAGVSSQTKWPGNGNWGQIDPYGTGNDVAVLTREGIVKGQLKYTNGYAADVVTFGSATINAGVRYDVQYGYNQGSATPANPVIPDILPALAGQNEASQFTWKNWQPRIGVTYAPGDAKKLLAKASYARFADQLGIDYVFHDNANALAGIYYYWNDANHDHVITRDEIDFADGEVGHYGFDPNNPTSVTSPNTFSPNLKAGVTDEFIAGLDYEILPDLVAGVAYTHRKYTGVGVTYPIGVSRSDFVFVKNLTGTLFDGTRFTAPLYGWGPGIAGAPPPGGSIGENRPDFYTTWSGIELTWQKRLSNKWMMRGSFTWADSRQTAGPGGCVNPNNSLSGEFGTSCPLNGSDIMVFPSGTGVGTRGNVFVGGRWAFNVSGLYELPLGFKIGANVYGREGYPFLQWVVANAGDGLGQRSILVGPMSAYRNPNVFDADLRLEKAVHVGPLQVSLSADVFNVANAGTVLERQGRCTLDAAGVCGGSYNTITDTLGPRVVRAGARISF